MKLLVNKAHFPVNVLGPGRRVGVWVQGCSIKCKDCCSTDTWEADPGTGISVLQLVQWIKEISAGGLDGITITGGEPFDQPKALKLLLEELRAWRRIDGLSFDVLLYSGFSKRILEKNFAAHLQLLDAFVPEPFVSKRIADNGLYGSTNQSVTLVSQVPEILERYRQWQSSLSAKRFQVEVDAKRLWFIGIPRQRELRTLELVCGERGLTMENVSWRC